MSIRNSVTLLLLFLMTVYVAYAAGISGGVAPQIGGGVEKTIDGGISGSGASITPPPTCGAGVLDLSTGCPLPMLGVF